MFFSRYFTYYEIVLPRNLTKDAIMKAKPNTIVDLSDYKKARDADLAKDPALMTDELGVAIDDLIQRLREQNPIQRVG
jgi:hypothetical protein